MQHDLRRKCIRESGTEIKSRGYETIFIGKLTEELEQVIDVFFHAAGTAPGTPTK